MLTKRKNTKLKRIIIIVALFLVAFLIYVEVVNRNSKQMTYRQKLLKAIYPAWMWWAKLSGKNAAELHDKKIPPVSFYSLKAVQNNGDTLEFVGFKGKKVLLVNTASDCGYTEQYDGLQKLQEEEQGKLVVLAFPANDFKQQEKGTDLEIAQFCKNNFGISFPLMQKSTVLKSPQQHVVFKWLSDPSQNGWNHKLPSWNFTKYLVNEQGILTHYFGPSISPLSKDVRKAIRNNQE